MAKSKIQMQKFKRNLSRTTIDRKDVIGCAQMGPLPPYLESRETGHPPGFSQRPYGSQAIFGEGKAKINRIQATGG